MWIIKMKFTNGEIYSMEEESATTQQWADVKFDRMLDRWRIILCNNRFMKNLIETDDSNDNPGDALYYIFRAIEYLNEKDGGHRTFDISQKEIEN